MPSRTAANQRYVPELDRIVLKAVNTKLNFTSQGSTRKATIFTRVLQLAHRVLNTRIHVTSVIYFTPMSTCFKIRRTLMPSLMILRRP